MKDEIQEIHDIFGNYMTRPVFEAYSIVQFTRGQDMDPRDREINQSRLKNAEKMASRFAEGSFERESWARIADGYRDLLNKDHQDTPKDGIAPVACS